MSWPPADWTLDNEFEERKERRASSRRLKLKGKGADDLSLTPESKGKPGPGPWRNDDRSLIGKFTTPIAAEERFHVRGGRPGRNRARRELQAAPARDYGYVTHAARVARMVEKYCESEPVAESETRSCRLCWKDLSSKKARAFWSPVKIQVGGWIVGSEVILTCLECKDTQAVDPSDLERR